MNNNLIHNTAIINENVVLGNNVEIGPYSIIGPNVKISDNVKIYSNVIIKETEIDNNSVVYPFSVIGCLPQDYKYNNEPGKVFIGKNVTIREQVTIHIGYYDNDMATIIGDDTYILVGCHIGHDAIIGKNCRIKNNALIAGHVIIEDNVQISASVAVSQFCRVGQYAMLIPLTGVAHDVIPYGMVAGRGARLIGLNYIGLQRANFSRSTIMLLSKAMKEIFVKADSNIALKDRVVLFKENCVDIDNNAEVNIMLNAIVNHSKCGLCRYSSLVDCEDSPETDDLLYNYEL